MRDAVQADALCYASAATVASREACQLGVDIGVTIGCLHAGTFAREPQHWHIGHANVQRAQDAACAHAAADAPRCAESFVNTVQAVFHTLALDEDDDEPTAYVPSVVGSDAGMLIRLSFRLATAATRYFYLDASMDPHRANDAIAHWCRVMAADDVDCRDLLLRQYHGWTQAGPLYWEPSPSLVAHIPLAIANQTLALALYADEPYRDAATAFCSELSGMGPAHDCVAIALSAIGREVGSWTRAL
ncbi:hypothetical protein SDRG_15848 [Saprolegnia diclina VS20]|uniref:Uncharacterized protein n=1 Tax=Saprolegnia diclina (strain VS20) TaxID=1156394 RepID=T0R2V9_SAPDV|nr:hypothetical protein SDRG_15848 [Saprolegnia diclina VS20]EQC26363.1 hypothetical protein SDRG_15848 [Saprolegnia diclina VS20]|eukprot:XP_008620256.1 hypothetical protein SDRG_15848 [Saprolegnia diclina VS20]